MRIEEIEGYIYNELSEHRMISFEAELSENKELLAEINLIRSVDLAIKENDVMQLRSSIQNIAGQISADKQTERSFAGHFKGRKIIYAAVAASLILMLSISGLLSREASHGELYQKFYTTYQTTGINRSAIMTTDQTLSIALQKFDNQDYVAAINLLREVIGRDQNNMVGHFYAGVSLQEAGKYQTAIHEYEAVMIDKDNLFVEQANWYIGLCYLRTGEDKKAYKQFNKIARKEGFYQQKAQAILRKMKVSEI
jgi:tetratricopeptide (TPR) repeat protein